MHSVDAYINRSMHRRCNYNQSMVTSVNNLLSNEAYTRSIYSINVGPAISPDIQQAIIRYYDTGIADLSCISSINVHTVATLPTDMILKLLETTNQMLEHKPFELVSIHDEYKAHPNNMNHVRQHYIDVLAELADSTVIEDILNQLTNSNGTYTKLSSGLSDYIKDSNYALS